jgi:hypothetical protein
MWRAFFIAVGFILVIVGLECLVVNRFMVASEARVPEFLAKMMGDDAGVPGTQLAANQPRNISPNVAPPQYFNQGYGGVPNSASRFGPSRLASKYSNDGGLGSQSRTNYPNSQFSLAGYGSRNNGPVQSSAISGNSRTVKILRTKEWMPWSLIAAGTIIVLYTKSLSGPDYGSD